MAALAPTPLAVSTLKLMAVGAGAESETVKDAKRCGDPGLPSVTLTSFTDSVGAACAETGVADRPKGTAVASPKTTSAARELSRRGADNAMDRMQGIPPEEDA